MAGVPDGHLMDRLVAAGVDAEIAESEDHGLNQWANTRAGGEVSPTEAYRIRVPKHQAQLATDIIRSD